MTWEKMRYSAHNHLESAQIISLGLTHASPINYRAFGLSSSFSFSQISITGTTASM